MQKELQWHQIIYGDKSNRVPKQRWGHKLVKVGNYLFTFGGYGGVRQGQGKFLKDIWKFDLENYQWEQIVTRGDVPESRSNYTIHYHQSRNQIIMFGGGTDNKNRFNTIFTLKIDTLIWKEIHFELSQEAPWERTYHTSQLFQNYLIVFGGEGVSNIDLNDTWLFDLETQKWKQLHPKGQIPMRRRFASSALVGSDFYLIGGCQNYYQQIGDMYKLSLIPIQENRLEDLTWEPLFSDQAILQRWGHSTDSHQGKIYIFAGRINSSTDDSELIEYDCQKNELKSLSISGKIPQPRRRHASVLVGDCMLVFGGYNGKYFNDFSYVKLPKKLSIQQNNVKMMKKIETQQQYRQSIKRIQDYFLDEQHLVVSFPTKFIKIPTNMQQLRKNNKYVDYSLKYNKIVQLPQFCSEDVARIVMLSILHQSMFIWSQQSIEECFKIIQLLEYLCCERLMTQMEKYLITRLTSSNSFNFLQKAIKYQLHQLAEESAFFYIRSSHFPSQNAEQFLNDTSINMNISPEQSTANQNLLRIISKVEDSIKFQIDQYHLRNSRKGFFKKTVQLFVNIFCSRNENSSQENSESSQRKHSCLKKVLMSTYRLCFMLGRRQYPKP